MTSRPLQIEYFPPKLLKPYKRNARLHSRHQIKQLVNSILKFGFINPILTDEQLVPIAGHGRLEASDQIGLKSVPVIRISGLTEAQKRALRIADNKLAENASWDLQILAEELKVLVDLDFDVSLTGFETAEIDHLFDYDGQKADQADRVEEPQRNAPAVSRNGDLWQLGRHRLLCGSSLEESSFKAVLGGELAEMAFADTPYNKSIDGDATGNGRTHHPEFQMASGEMSEAAFVAFLKTIIALLASFTTQGSILYLMIDWGHIFELLTAAKGLIELKNICVWAKTNGGMGSLYRSQHELVGVFKNGKAPHINNILLGKWGRNRTNIWTYAGVNTFRAGRAEDLADHPTIKPIALVADAILDCSNIGGLVLDPFAGSGTTILACERTKRRAAVIEIDPYYVDVAIRRFEKATGIKAIHSDTGLEFEELRRQRGSISMEVSK
jgi:DNA modification methylase